MHDTEVVSCGHNRNRKTGKLESYYIMYHPEGTVPVKVIDGEKTMMKASYGGFKHVGERMAVFDESHLKRVTRTFVQDCITTAAGGKVKNQVQHKADYLKSITTKKGTKECRKEN